MQLLFRLTLDASDALVKAGAKYTKLGEKEISSVLQTYADWDFDGKGTAYEKTGLAWQSALKKKLG